MGESSMHVLNHDGQNTVISASPTSSSSSTIQPSSNSSSYSSNGKRGQTQPPQRAPSLPLPVSSTQGSPTSHHDAHAHTHLHAPTPVHGSAAHRNPPSSLTSLLLSPGRECNSPPSFNAALPPAPASTLP